MKQQVAQKQHLTISQQVRQSLELLQMQAIDLQAVVMSASEQNPFLEVDAPVVSKTRTRTSNHSNYNDIYNLSSRPLTLKEYLAQQIQLQGLTEYQKLLASYLTDTLDVYGYLTISTAELATEIPCTEAELEEILYQMQKLDPAGVYARNLRECLRLQLQDRSLWSAIYETMLNNLELLARRDWPALARICRVGVEEIRHMAANIQHLDPKPGRNFGDDSSFTLIPEATVHIDAGQQLKVTFNRTDLPDIVINHNLYNQVITSAQGEERKFYQEHYRQAQWLLKAIEQRARTIVGVTKAIVELQYEFFIGGISHLKPMTLKQVAAKVGVHESTVSRVTNKCISTPFGIFTLKYFFASEIRSSIYENTYSSNAIKEKIRQLIVSEDSSKPLSDDVIALQLRNQGLIISRRTIAKYREALKLSPSHLRRIKKII